VGGTHATGHARFASPNIGCLPHQAKELTPVEIGVTQVLWASLGSDRFLA
jgi:hypothetical protein